MTISMQTISKKNNPINNVEIQFEYMECFVITMPSVTRRTRDARDNGETTKVSVSVKDVFVQYWRIKWENILSLRVYPTSDALLQEDVEEDHKRFRLEMEVREEKQNKDCYVCDDDYTGLIRTYLLHTPVAKDKHHSWISQWQTFQTALKECFVKERKKREKRAIREREAAEEQQQKPLSNNHRFGGAKNHITRRRGNTYSRRGEKFLASNRRNIAENRNLPDRYDGNNDEEGFWETHQQGKETKEETMNRLRAEESVFRRRTEGNDSVKSSARSEEDKEVEFKGTIAKQDDDGGHAHATNFAASDGETTEETPLLIETNTDDTSEVHDTMTGTKIKSVRPAKIKKRKFVREDHSDDEDDVFGTQPGFTTPSSQRVVSPGTIGKRRKRVVLDDSGDELEDSVHANHGEATMATATVENGVGIGSEDEEDSANQKITLFFDKSTSSVRKASPMQQPQKKPRALSRVYGGDCEATKHMPSSTATKPKVDAKNFFAPRKPVTSTLPMTTKQAGLHDDSETSTVLDSRKTTPAHRRRHAVDKPSEDEKDDKENFMGIESKSVEEEDPIDEFDSSQSQQGLFSRRRRPSRLRHKKESTTSSAFGALDFADSRSTKMSPVQLVKSGERPTAYLSLEKKNKRPTPSSLSPAKKLYFDAQVDEAIQPTSKWRGLLNEGNTCYLNSSLQALFSVQPFMKAMQPLEDGHELVASLVCLWKNLNKVGDNYGAASARLVKQQIDKSTHRFEGSEQRDAHEFLGEVIDAIHEELAVIGSEASTIGETQEPINAFFRMDVRVFLTCKSCQYSRSKDEIYRNLSLDISANEDGPPSVQSCLASFFQPEEREIKCEKCEEGRFAMQEMKILSKPKALLLHLKRFIVEERQWNNENDSNGSVKLMFRKNKSAVDLTPQISLDHFSADGSGSKSQKGDTSYSLKSVVHHIGITASSGHYTADASRDGSWVSFDDGVARDISLDDVVNPRKKKQTAYMLMYSLD